MQCIVLDLHVLDSRWAGERNAEGDPCMRSGGNKECLPITERTVQGFPHGDGGLEVEDFEQLAIYCISCYFREGFIFANFASQTLAKISTSIHVYL